MVFSPDGKTLASGSRDQTVKLWDVATGAELRTLKSHSPIYAVAFSPDGNTIAVDAGGTVKLLDVSSGAELRTIEATSVNTVAFSPDGKILASGAADGAIKLWDVSTGDVLRILEADSSVRSLAFSSDGARLASGSWKGAVKLWSVSTGEELRTLNGQFQIQSLAFTPDGKILASDEASSDKTVRLWDPSTGAELRTFKLDTDVRSIAFSRDSKSLASGNTGTVKLLDIATGAHLATLKERFYVETMAFSPNGKVLACGSPVGAIRLWDVSTGVELGTLERHTFWVESVAVSPDAKTLASTSFLGTAKLWSIAGGTEVHTFSGKSGFNSQAFSPDNKIFASGSSPDEVTLWDVASGCGWRTLKTGSVSTVAFSPDGKILASGTTYGLLRLWDVATGAELQPIKVGSVDKVGFSPDGKILASTSYHSNNKTVKLWDIATGAELGTLTGHSKDIGTIAFSPDGAILASGSYDHTIKLWNVASGTEVRAIKGDSVGGVLSLAFSSDGKILASGGQDDVIKLWNVSTGAEICELTGHSGLVNSLTLTTDGKYLVSGSRDSTIKVWDVRAGRELATLIALDQDDWLVVTPDGLFDGSPAAWKQILWRFNNDTFEHAPVESFFNEFYYPGLLTEIFSDKHPKAPSEISQKDRRQPRLKLEVANLRTEAAVRSRDVKIRVEVSQAPAGVQDLRLFRNGSLVKVWHGNVLKGRSSATLEAMIPIVAEENRLTAYAFNRDNVKSSDATLIINGADSLKRNGIVYVIAVGVNEYANSDYNLRYAAADAKDFAEELKRQQARVNNYERVEVISLNDRDATKANILKSLADIATKVQPEDAVVIYFAGHGQAQGNRFYLIPHDLGYMGSSTQAARDPEAMPAILAHSISDEELERAVEGIDAGQLVMIIDACDSGQALEAEEKRRGPMNSKGLAQLAYEKGMYILTATQSLQQAWEPDRLGHGYLTYALVEEGLKTNAADRAPKDGQVLLREWLDYATERVPIMQQEKIEAHARRIRDLENAIKFAESNPVQRPRVFYRREIEATPFVVARPEANASQNCRSLE